MPQIAVRSYVAMSTKRAKICRDNTEEKYNLALQRHTETKDTEIRESEREERRDRDS